MPNLSCIKKVSKGKDKGNESITDSKIFIFNCKTSIIVYKLSIVHCSCCAMLFEFLLKQQNVITHKLIINKIFSFIISHLVYHCTSENYAQNGNIHQLVFLTSEQLIVVDLKNNTDHCRNRTKDH